MSRIDQIYQDGRHYDYLFSNAHDKPQFWLHQAEQFGDPILELACGTWRIAVPLAQHGHTVSGIDLSESMLAEARRKAHAATVALDLNVADMCDFELKQKFALVLLANNALCHLLDLGICKRCDCDGSGLLSRIPRFG